MKAEHPPLGADVRPKAAPASLAERCDYALSLLDRDRVPKYRTRQKMISRKFAVAMSTAADDIKRAAAKVSERINELAGHMGGVIKQSMERVALRAEKDGKLEVASVTWYRLAKLCGLAEVSEETQARRLSDAALDAAIKGAVAARVEHMSEAELEELLARRRAALGATS